MSEFNNFPLLLIVAVVGLIAYYFFSTKKSKQRLYDEMKQASLISDLKPITINARWYARNESVDVANFSIQHGFIYVGERLLDEFDIPIEDTFCFINPKLDILQPRSLFRKMNHSVVSYSNLTPEERGIYLHWLTTARSETEVDPNYVVLFLFGLERRLTVDDQYHRISLSERIDLEGEIKRLIELYPKHEQLQQVGYKLLLLIWAQNDATPPPFGHMIQNSQSFVSILVESMPLILAKYALEQDSLPPIIASSWVLSLSGYTPEQQQQVAIDPVFKDHFTHYYRELFPEGVLLRQMTEDELSDGEVVYASYSSCSPSALGKIELKHPILPLVTETETILIELHKIVVSYYDPEGEIAVAMRSQFLNSSTHHANDNDSSTHKSEHKSFKLTK